jgi:hypothetical protein
MESFGIKDVIYICGIVVSMIATFLTTKHNLKEYIRDKHDELKDQMNQMKLETANLKAKDDLQQQVIDQIGKQMEGLIPKLVDAIKEKEYDSSKR